jgi:serine/threonine-protein kinase
MTRKLIVLAGPDEGRVFPIEADTLLIGRSRATNTALIDGHVSRVHCQVLIENGTAYLSDFESGPGTFVNGQRIARHLLKPGDLIRIGRTSLQYTDVDAAEPAKPRGWAESLVGQSVGHYKVGSLLARGRRGFVFHGRDTRRNLPIVLKVLEASVLANDSAIERFTTAMKAVLPLRHPHLLKVYAAGRAGGHGWIATEYFRGENLAAVIARTEDVGKIDWRNVVRVGIYLTRALEYAHNKKLLHTNVTPQNILVGKTPQETKLTDLMVATAIEDDPLAPIAAMGTPSEALSYQAPERTEPGSAPDARSDVYGMGATLYAMLTGRPPLQGSTVDELVAKIRRDMPVHFETLELGTPAHLGKMVFKMLAKKPDERFASAREALAELVRVAKEEKITY